MPKTPNTISRRYDLDWLRVIAFVVLIYFHAAVAFLPKGLPLTVNAESSVVAQYLVAFSSQFRLALLFFVSGCGVFFALKHRTRQQFFKERSQRLLIPLLFGILVLVPPMVYLEHRYIGARSDSFWNFYRQLFSAGVYPAGNLSWHHFWFIAYLYLFCLIGWSLFQRLRSDAWQARLSSWLERPGFNIYTLYLPIIPLLVVEIVLRPLFPGFRDLIHDWASFSHWFIIFILGFVFASKPQLLYAAKQLRWKSLGCGLALITALFAFFWNPERATLYPFIDEQLSVSRFLFYSILTAANSWCWILVCVGFAARYLNRPSTILTYLTQAVYPLFCLHLTVLVILEYLILPLDWSIATKYWLIANSATVLIFIIHEITRRIPYLRVCLGNRQRNIPSIK